MCGIVGYWKNKPLVEEDDEIILRMMRAISHRGPDSQGCHRDINRGLLMGHTRLSIIDLHTGDQPLYSDKKELVLTVNGEFYDYKRIRARLMCFGTRFTTKSDSELALRLYEKYGMDFVTELRGEFAFSLFDEKRDSLILVRDRFGIRPLYYSLQGENVYYASEIKAILEHPDMTPELADEASINQLMQCMVPGTTAFKGIEALKPGYMLIARRTAGGLDVRQEKYWDAEFPNDGGHKVLADEDWVRDVREKLIECVQLRLEADVPVACYLSGGIDSCSILGLATGAQQSPVKAFTISFEHADYDESVIAKEMAEHMGADQDVLQVDGDDLYGDSYIKALWHAERTFYNTLGVAKWHMSKHVNQCNYKVVVTGEGSDELFGGYPFFKRDYFLHGMTDEESAVYQKSLDRSNKLFQGAILAEKEMRHPAFEGLLGFTPSWIQPWMMTLELVKPLLSDRLRKVVQNYDPVGAIAESFDPAMLEGRHPLDKTQYTWIKTMLEGQILNWGGDRMDMANAMESRPPFLDHHLAEMAFQIPPELRIRGNTEKWVLREAMRGVLPEILYRREKFAFMAPPGHKEPKNQRGLKKLIDSFLTDSIVKEADIVDNQRLKGFIEGYYQDSDPLSLTRKDTIINHLLGLHILFELYVSRRLRIASMV